MNMLSNCYKITNLNFQIHICCNLYSRGLYLFRALSVLLKILLFMEIMKLLSIESIHTPTFTDAKKYLHCNVKMR